MATTKKKNEGLSGAAAAAARVALGDAGKVTSSATTSRKASTRTSSGSSSGNTVRNRTNGIDYTVSSGNGIYGVPTINSEKKNYTQNGVTYQAGPIMNRVTDPDIIKNGYYNSNGYTVFVDDDGYAYRASKGVSDYTPHLDINAGNGSYNTSGSWTDNEVLTASDLQKIADIRSQMQAGLITGDKANQMANQIRSGYGYTIDKQGNVTDLLAKSRVDSRRKAWELPTNGMSTEQQNFLNLMFPEQQGYGSEALLSALSGLQNGYQTPTYSDAPTWNGSEWDNVLNALADQLLNMNYTDWTKGDQYQALADRYGQQGKLSMQDVLGQISSKTGGLASSYAATAAQQQYNSFMSQLEDAAMDMYNVERNDLYDRANMARQYAQDDYNRYVDDYNRWENDRNYQYQLNRDAIEDSRYDQEWQYQQDQLARQQAEDQAQTLAKYGDFSGYKALGYTDAQIALMEAAYQMQNTKKTGGGGGGGDDPVSQDYNGLFRAAYDAGDNAKSFIANNYGDYGFDKSTGLYEEFTEAAKTPVRSGFEMNASNFNATMQSISAQLQAGKTDAATANIERVWTSLSGQQKRQLQNFLKNYGMEYQP